MVWIIAGIIVLGGVLAGPIVSDVEQPNYTVVRADDAIELRDYVPVIVAETTTHGAREPAIQSGFRTIADYIFGNNTAGAKVAMTAPVTQQTSEKIAMTAPVTQQGSGQEWSVHFVMPARYSLATLPTPNNPAVKLREVPAKRFAVVRFSGMASEANLTEHREALERWVEAQKLRPLAAPAYAFYNPPWTLPFMRRNEVMVEVAK